MIYLIIHLIKLFVHIFLDGNPIRNPVLERLTGQANRYNALHNDSYYKVNNQIYYIIILF